MAALKPFLFVNIFLIFLFSLYSAETIFVPEKTLLFKEENKNNWVIKAVVQKDFYGEIIKKEKVFLQQLKVIGIYVDAYYIKIPGTDGLCYFPDVTFKKQQNGTLTPCSDKIEFLMFLGIIILVMGLAALAGYFHLKSEKKKYLLPVTLLLIFGGYACWYIGFASGSFINPTDDIQYFNIAKKLLALDFTSMQYRYTIGFPIICMPFISLFHCQDYMEFISCFMNFQTFILIPGIFLVLYGLFNKKMGFSWSQSFSILLLWLALMIFYMPMSGIMEMDPAKEYVPEFYRNNAFFSLPETNLSFAFINLTWLGRNAMSDHTAVFLLFVLLYAAMKKSRSLIRFSLLSMGFGFLCLVRINYIFFAPLLAFVFYDSFSELWQNKRNYLYAALCGTAGFMIVFIWQFVLNKIQFGSPFIWPYSLHQYAPDRGFVWSVVPYGFKFLCQTNYVYIILGVSSLFFLPDRKTRVLLTLWIFPTLLFFCGYPIVFNNPVRFIFALYPPLTAAIVLNPVWRAAWSVRIKAALVVFCLCILCKSNIFFIHFLPWNAGQFGISNNVFMVIQSAVFLFCCGVIFSMRKELKADYANTILHVCFLILFTAVFFIGSIWVYLAGVMVLAAFAYGLRDTWLAIRQIGSENKIING